MTDLRRIEELCQMCRRIIKEPNPRRIFLDGPEAKAVATAYLDLIQAVREYFDFQKSGLFDEDCVAEAKLRALVPDKEGG